MPFKFFTTFLISAENLSSVKVVNEIEKVSSNLDKPSALMKQSVLAKPSVMCRICLMNEELER